MSIGVQVGGTQAIDSFSNDINDVVSAKKSSHSPVGMTSLQAMLLILAEVANDLFEDIMGIAMVMATGEGLRGIQELADMDIEINGVSIQEMLNSDEFTDDMDDIQSKIDNMGDALIEWDSETMILTYSLDGGTTWETPIDLSDNEYFTLSLGAGTKDDAGNITYTFNDLSLKLLNSEGILQNPGTLFYIQQMLQQLKDGLQAVTAVGKTGGDAASQQSQTFARDVAQ